MTSLTLYPLYPLIAQFVHNLFVEVDQDRSGAIDKGEFRQMLRKLNLTYSDHRFNLLFRAVDKIGGDGLLEEEELTDFMFPSEGSQDGDEPEKKDDAAEAALARFSGQMKR
jgi:Ca2+-binding EF-hand superfamily protein